MYAIFDSKIKAFNNPIYMRNAGEATRAFEQVANDDTSLICKHPEDYTLFEIGEFDDETGSINCYEARIPLGQALQFKKEKTALKSVQ